MRLIAQFELTLAPGERFINKAIADQYPERSLDSIRALRHKAGYKLIVERERARLLQGSPLQHLRVGGLPPPTSNTRAEAETTPPMAPYNDIQAAQAEALLVEHGLEAPGLAHNLTECPLTYGDLRVLYDHFGVKLKTRKGKAPSKGGSRTRLPGESNKAFKQRLYREHQRLFALGPKVLLQELEAGAGGEPIREITHD